MKPSGSSCLPVASLIFGLGCRPPCPSGSICGTSWPVAGSRCHISCFSPVTRSMPCTDRIFHLGAKIGRQRHAVDRPVHDQRRSAPAEHDDRHDRGGDHDLQRLAARFVDAQQVLAEEVQGDQAGDGHRIPSGERCRPCRDSSARSGLKIASESSTSPMMYWPADMPLTGPVRM